MAINDPLLYYDFDASSVSGTTVTGKGSSGSNGTLHGSPTIVTGYINQAVSINAAGDYMDNGVIVNTAKATISAWVKITAYPSSGNRAFILGMFEGGPGSSTCEKVLYVDSAGKLFFYAYDGAFHATSTPVSTVIPLNTWTHILGVADGTNITAYQNNVAVGAIACGNTYASYGLPNFHVGSFAAANLFGGNFSELATAGPFSLDEARVYNRDLSTSEIAQLFAFSGPAKGGSTLGLGLNLNKG